jgi:5-methylcytosine-specific restriction enzyme subunit McrC
MARLFEQFVFNFYAREQHHFAVHRPIIAWHDAQGTDADVNMLPVMRTDVVLSAAHRRVVIDTKYYENAFQSYRGSRTIRSTHLYQLITYLANFAAKTAAQQSYTTPHPKDASSSDSPRRSDLVPHPVSTRQQLEGMLLYPSVGEDFRKSYILLGHRLTVRSVNLGRPWRQIHHELLDAVGVAPPDSTSHL